MCLLLAALILGCLASNAAAQPVDTRSYGDPAHSPSGHANGTSSTIDVPQGRPVATGVARVIEGPAPPLPPDVIARDDQGRATIRAVRVTDVQVDGQLDEPVYLSNGSISGFIQNIPDVGQPGSQRTEAWVLFDDDNVYVAARCWDTAPESDWVANEMRRDSRGIQQNDNFGVVFDTFYDRRNGVVFYANPLGGMRDIQITNEGNVINQDWNPVWDVRTGRFDGGWSLEIRVPFKSLRYRPGRQQVWGVQMRRGIRRRNEFAFITPLLPQLGQAAWIRVSMSATLVGLEVPAGSRNLEIKPYGISGVRTDAPARRLCRTISAAMSGWMSNTA